MRAEFSRPVDGLGRICLPKEIRDSLGIEAKDRLSLTVSDSRVILEKMQSNCIVCGGSQSLKRLEDDRLICKQCICLIQQIKL